MSDEDAATLREDINTAFQERREKFKDMSEEKRDEYRRQEEEVRQNNAENVMMCGCCSSNPDLSLMSWWVSLKVPLPTPSGGGYGGDRLQAMVAMVEAECPDYISSCPSSCPSESIDIGTERVLEKPKKPNVDWSGLALEERDELKEQMQVLRDVFKEQVLKCSCCTGLSVAELLGSDEASSSSEDGNDEASSGDATSAESEEEANELLGRKFQFTFPIPNHPHIPHRGHQHGQF